MIEPPPLGIILAHIADPFFERLRREGMIVFKGMVVFPLEEFSRDHHITSSPYPPVDPVPDAVVESPPPQPRVD